RLAPGAWDNAPCEGQGGLMSAINSNSGDRDLDEVHRAQRAHEPSMEEILASIRNIIADDPIRGAPREPPGPAPSQMARVIDSSDRPVEGEPSEVEQPRAAAPAIVWRRPQAVEAEPAAGPAGGDEAPLLSPEANEAAALPMNWCARRCGRCSSNGWTRTCPRSSSGWCGRKSSGSRAGGHSGALT